MGFGACIVQFCDFKFIINILWSIWKLKFLNQYKLRLILYIDGLNLIKVYENIFPILSNWVFSVQIMLPNKSIFPFFLKIVVLEPDPWIPNEHIAEKNHSLSLVKFLCFHIYFVIKKILWENSLVRLKTISSVGLEVIFEWCCLDWFECLLHWFS